MRASRKKKQGRQALGGNMKQPNQPKKSQRGKVQGSGEGMSPPSGRKVLKRRRARGRKHISA